MDREGGKRGLKEFMRAAAIVAGVVMLLLYAFRLDPCNEVARIKLEEYWAKESGVPPWYPEPGARERFEKRKAEMQQKCAAQ